jgi:hypothetical protein
LFELDLKDLFVGWNYYEGHRRDHNSLAKLARLTPEELTLDKEIREWTPQEFASRVEECISRVGEVKIPDGLCTWENWNGLRFERVYGRGKQRSVRSTMIGLCWALLANCQRLNYPADSSAVGWTVLKATPERPRMAVKLTLWTIRKMCEVSMAAARNTWEKELCMGLPWPMQGGRRVSELTG